MKYWKFKEFSFTEFEFTKYKSSLICSKSAEFAKIIRKSVPSCLPWICGAFGLYPWQSELIRPFVVDVGCTDAFEMGAVGMEVNGACFRRMVSRSRRWLENDVSKNGRWPMPNVRNGWPPFGPKNIVIIKNQKKKNENETKIAVFKTMYADISLLIQFYSKLKYGKLFNISFAKSICGFWYAHPKILFINYYHEHTRLDK